MSKKIYTEEEVKAFKQEIRDLRDKEKATGNVAENLPYKALGLHYDAEKKSFIQVTTTYDKEGKNSLVSEAKPLGNDLALAIGLFKQNLLTDVVGKISRT